MSERHRSNAAVECSDKVSHRAAGFLRTSDDSRNNREHVLDAMVELGNEQALVLLRLLVLSDVSRQALDAQQAPGCIKFTPCRLLQPHLSPVRTVEAESQCIGWVVRAEGFDSCFEVRAILGRYVAEKIVM